MAEQENPRADGETGEPASAETAPAEAVANEAATVETPPEVTAETAPASSAAQADEAAPQAAPESPKAPLPPPQPDRRVAPRYIAHWRAALVSVNDGEVRYLGTTDNLCPLGAAISCDIHVPPQQDYHIYLEIPQSIGKAPIVIQMQGRVLHTTLSRRVFRVGVVFKQFHGDAEQVLRAILASGKLKQLIVEH